MREKNRDVSLGGKNYHNFSILFSKILPIQQHICLVTIVSFDVYLIPASSVVACQVSLSRGPGTKPMYLCWDEGGNFSKLSL